MLPLCGGVFLIEVGSVTMNLVYLAALAYLQTASFVYKNSLEMENGSIGCNNHSKMVSSTMYYVREEITTLKYTFRKVYRCMKWL